MILLLDNYDSFTYNLVQRIGEINSDLDVQVYRNDKITVQQAKKLNPSHIIISPGPCTPNEAGVSIDIVKAFAGNTALLGVCLGHQSIGQAFGMKIVRSSKLMHGKTSEIRHDSKTIFSNLPNPFTATRYHSLIIAPNSFDSERFEMSAWTKKGEIMGLRAKKGVFGPAPLEGVQFHPESFLTNQGHKLIANFLNT